MTADATTARVGALASVAATWPITTTAHRRPLVAGLLPHLDTVSRESYVDEAAVAWEHADAIRDGRGGWREFLAVYLSDADRTGLEDAAELDAAEECARAVARDVLLRAVEADLEAERDRKASRLLAEAQEIVDRLIAS